jgi:hypothetical protein
MSYWKYYSLQFKDLVSYIIPSFLKKPNLTALLFIILMLLNPLAIYVMYMYDTKKIPPDPRYYEDKK